MKIAVQPGVAGRNRRRQAGQEEGRGVAVGEQCECCERAGCCRIGHAGRHSTRSRKRRRRAVHGRQRGSRASRQSRDQCGAFVHRLAPSSVPTAPTANGGGIPSQGPTSAGQPQFQFHRPPPPQNPNTDNSNPVGPTGPQSSNGGPTHNAPLTSSRPRRLRERAANRAVRVLRRVVARAASLARRRRFSAFPSCAAHGCAARRRFYPHLPGFAFSNPRSHENCHCWRIGPYGPHAHRNRP